MFKARPFEILARSNTGTFWKDLGLLIINTVASEFESWFELNYTRDS